MADAAARKPNKNRLKKLKAQYLSILELEQRAAAGDTLDEGQASKLARKDEVAAELCSLGAPLPQAPAPSQQPLEREQAATTGTGGLSEGADISEHEIEAAMQSLLGEGSPRQPDPSCLTPALRRQYQLLGENPGHSYFLVLPDPFPDMGVQLQDSVGAIFFEAMKPRAEAGNPRAVRMMFETLRPSAERAGLPLLQLRLQLTVEYGIDPITEQHVSGSLEEQKAWVEGKVSAAERSAAEAQLLDLARRTMAAGQGRRRRR